MTLGLRAKGKCMSQEAERTGRKQTTDVNSLNSSSADGKKEKEINSRDIFMVTPVNSPSVKKKKYTSLILMV